MEANLENNMDLLIFRRDFLKLLIDHLPDEALVETIQSVILNVAGRFGVNVVDISPSGFLKNNLLSFLVVSIKKKLVYNTQEKPFLQANRVDIYHSLIPISLIYSFTHSNQSLEISLEISLIHS